MRMVGGELGDIVTDADQLATWTALLTCFFLDACPSVVGACEHARALLRPGGIWLNLGPLLYHWNRSAASVPRLCADEVLALVESAGFELIESGWREATYSQVCPCPASKRVLCPPSVCRYCCGCDKMKSSLLTRSLAGPSIHVHVDVSLPLLRSAAQGR